MDNVIAMLHSLSNELSVFYTNMLNSFLLQLNYEIFEHSDSFFHTYGNLSHELENNYFIFIL